MAQERVSRRTVLTRRGFFGRTATAGVGSLTAASILGADGANDGVGVGFIGVGGRGSHLLRETLRLAEAGVKVKPVAVCDIYDVRLQEAAAAAKLPDTSAYRDYRELLANPAVDAVVVATPDHWHAPQALAAIKAGKDVYCEKPFTLTHKESQEVAEEASKAKKIVQVGVNACSDSRYLEASKLIAEGKIGKVLLTTGHHSRNSKAGEWNYAIDPKADPKKNLDWNAFLGSATKRSWEPERYFRWRKFWDYSGGIATDLFFHQLSYLLLAIDGTEGEFPRRVSSFGGIYQFYDREVPDTFTTMVDYPSNHTVVLVSSMANDVGVPEAIRGHEGTIFFEGNDMVVRFQDGIVGAKPELRIPKTRNGDAYEHLENFFSCVASRDESKLACPASLAHKIQVAIQMAVISYREAGTAIWHRRQEKIYICGEEK